MSEYIIDWDENLVIDTFSKNSLREEIVRCRDCKYAIDNGAEGTADYCGRPDGNGGYLLFGVEPDGYCAWACRKSE